MRKTPTFVFLTAALALVVLAACAPAKTPPTAVPTKTPLAASPSPVSSGLAGCTVESSLIPTADPAQLAQYPGPTPDDWSKGPTDAAVTFIEYGDYQ